GPIVVAQAEAAMMLAGTPDAGNPYVQFDKRGPETGQCHRARPQSTNQGRKRHALVDADGRGLTLHAHSVNVYCVRFSRPVLRSSPAEDQSLPVAAGHHQKAGASADRTG